jgi:hypothetical protein
MSYFGATTVATAYNATAATLQTNLRNLSTIGSVGVNVTKTGSVFTISFQPSIVKPANTLTANGALLTGGNGTLATTASTQIGKIAGYNRNVQEWYAGTDGKFYIGGGSVVADSSGLKIDTTNNDPWYADPASFSSSISFVKNLETSTSEKVFTIGSSAGYTSSSGPFSGWSQNSLWIGGQSINTSNTVNVIYLRAGGYPPSLAIANYFGGSRKIYAFSDIEVHDIGDGQTGNITAEGTISSTKIITSGILEARNTQLMRYKYGPSGFNDPNTTPYLEYTVTSNTGGWPYGSFLVSFAGRDGGSNTTQELWHFQVYRSYQGFYVWSSQRIAGTANVFAREITNTAGSSTSFTGTLTIRWWVGSTGSSYNDGLEITVSELSSGLNAGHYGAFSVGSTATVTGNSPTTAQQGNMLAGTINATNGVIVPASNNSAVFALDASSGVTATLSQGSAYFPFGNANNFSGIIMVTNTSNNNAIGLFLVGSTSISLISDTSGSTYTTNSGTTNRINVYLSSGAVVVQQQIAGSKTIRTAGIRMGTST